MGFIRMIVGLPIIIVIAVFAFMNDVMISFDFWPFTFKVNISQSFAIIILVFLGYVIGKIDSWMSYSPVRAALRAQLRQNRKLNVQHQKLNEQVQGLQGAVGASKKPIDNTDKPGASIKNSIKEKMANLFKKTEQDKPKEDDYW